MHDGRFPVDQRGAQCLDLAFQGADIAIVLGIAGDGLARRNQGCLRRFAARRHLGQRGGGDLFPLRLGGLQSFARIDLGRRLGRLNLYFAILALALEQGAQLGYLGRAIRARIGLSGRHPFRRFAACRQFGFHFIRPRPPLGFGGLQRLRRLGRGRRLGGSDLRVGFLAQALQSRPRRLLNSASRPSPEFRRSGGGRFRPFAPGGQFGRDLVRPRPPFGFGGLE